MSEGWLCLCGTHYDRFVDNVTESHCNMPCQGDATIMCGGNMYSSVYQLPAAEGGDVIIDDPGEFIYNILVILCHFFLPSI